MKFGFIGAGKVGFSLGKYFAVNGHTVTGYFSEFYEDAVEASRFTKSTSYNNIEHLVEDSDVLFLTVPDGMIEQVWNVLKKIDISGKIVCHCSGALSSKVFSDISELGGFGYSIHPLFAVSDKYNSYKELSNSYFTIEGSSQKMNVIRQILEEMGNTVCVITSENKVKYHAAAAIASNLVVGLIGLSEQLLSECGFLGEDAHNALVPIIQGNIGHIIKGGLKEALTGPIERNDIQTIEKHISILDGNAKQIYKAVSQKVLDIAKDKNEDRDYRKIEEILK